LKAKVRDILPELLASQLLPPQESRESVWARLRKKYSNLDDPQLREEMESALSKTLRTSLEFMSRLEAIKLGEKKELSAAKMSAAGNLADAMHISETAMEKLLSDRPPRQALSPLLESLARIKDLVPPGDRDRVRALWLAKVGEPDNLAGRVERGVASAEELKVAAEIIRGDIEIAQSHEEVVRNRSIWMYVRFCTKFLGLSQKQVFPYVTKKYNIEERQIYTILKRGDALMPPNAPMRLP